MPNQTLFNAKIEKFLEKIVEKEVKPATVKHHGFWCKNGRQIDLQLEDKKEINIWTEAIDIGDTGLAQFRKYYNSKDRRRGGLTSNAPRLGNGNAAYLYKFNVKTLGEDEVESLVNRLLALYDPNNSELPAQLNESPSPVTSSSMPMPTAISPSGLRRLDEDTKRLTTSERDAVVKVRYGQGAFREALIEKKGAVCWMSGIEGKELLIASHIKPWSKSDDDPQARGNCDNGLLLSALWDAVFDAGLICFDENYKVVCSSKLSESARNALGITTNTVLPMGFRNEERAAFLKYHRDICFKA